MIYLLLLLCLKCSEAVKKKYLRRYLTKSELWILSFCYLFFVDFFQSNSLVIPNYQLKQIWFLKEAQYKNVGGICSAEI